MSTFNQIQTACGALGYYDAQTYLKDDDCEGERGNLFFIVRERFDFLDCWHLAALRILLRCLKYESERKDARLQMLDSKIIENDLIPILIHLEIKHDRKIIHHALK